MQFFKIAVYVQVAQLYGLVHYAACTFCHIEMACGLLLLVSIAYRAVLCGLGLYGRLESESVSVFDGFVFISVDVKLFVNVFIYYNCMGRLSVRVCRGVYDYALSSRLVVSVVIDEVARRSV